MGREANGSDPEPCYDCACCLAWAQALEVLAGSVKEHAAAELTVTLRGERLVASCGNASCLVCGGIEWQTPR